MIQLDDVQVKDNLTYEASPLRIEDREVKHLRDNEIPLVNIVWEGSVAGSMTWELESQMKESYQGCFLQVNFRGRKFLSEGEL